MLELFSPAKLNLFLHITAKRQDGYHELQSVFRAIDFGDWMSFSLIDDTASPLVVLTGADTLTDDINDNLIVKAVQLLAKHHADKARPIAIHLDKKIPTGAGLGGGSSNAATTLLAVNTLWQLGLDTETLIAYGTKLGADVPFFIFSHAHQADALAMGIGELLSTLHLPSARYLLLLPPDHLSTAQYFGHPSLQKNCPVLTDIDTRYDDYGKVLTAEFGNVFEPIALDSSPATRTALDYLRTLETDAKATARMSGTGSTVFLPISDEIDDATLTAWQLSAPCPSVVAMSLYDY
ncbi:4-(cytidine 5'-diphospho)-2-C-methyl-D-erythritol kinase [Moraxella pluranimalium]|uniref:4-diphosphocytidyl-2-C-methyl-D-erythritol kinase n=1 Tax=Moraxella pluranimalium TaxID=470453 RepID=A0A1T0CP86_9GAMM|nr:4-(cytidine 5'-diphospho)-2-C-methyl-D-erythritol kinase [Moraxella pluranimalium]OOS24155.1 4-(cytidine 5'-diphospho)-2-C-methyl-D-erythritol kinase [Moraxella pluranimalium]